MDSEVSDSEVEDVEEEKSFINQLLVEMKSQFNMFDKKPEDSKETIETREPDSTECLSGEVSSTVTNEQENIIEDLEDNKLEIKELVNNEEIMTGEVETNEKCVQVSSPVNLEISSELNSTTDHITDTSKEIDVNWSDLDDKPLTEIKKLEESTTTVPNIKTEQKETPQSPPSPVKRSPRIRVSNDETFKTTYLKRSKRRRSKESILQSAIARKEKFYNNESTHKPQRLTRQLRPTQKILENLASAKKKSRPGKNKYSDEELESEQEESDSNARNKKPFKRNGKKIKSEVSSESEEGSNVPENESALRKRRSQRISSKVKDDVDAENTNPVLNIADEAKHLPDEPECSSVTSVSSQLISSRLCLCTQNSTLFRQTNEKEEVFCTAIDGIGDKLIGCSRLVDCKNSAMLRSSRRMPYGVFCDVHKNRLIRHNCCPTCGVFCTQGKFAECDAKHQYHKNCQISVGNLECCPHCGISAPSRDILITMHSDKKPIFLTTQKSYCPSAKMSFHAHENYPTRSNSPLLLPEKFENIANIETNGQEFDENDLLEAVASENCEQVTRIIASGLDLNFKLSDFNEGTILHFAAQVGLLPILHVLVSSKMEIDEFDNEQNTPLMLSVTENKNEVVQYLVKAGASITLKGTDGMTALHLAAKSGNLEACQILVKAGCAIANYVNTQDDGGWTPLVWACEHGFLDVATFLILKGADHSLRDVEHNVALHWAAFSGSTNIAELLLNLGCDVNAVNAHGDTPLHIAAREERYNSAIVLLARGADVSIVNKNNETALDCAPENTDTYNVIALNVRLHSITGFGERRKTILTNDISRGRETNPIQCINMVDADPEPSDFSYITKNRVSSDKVVVDCKLTTVHSCSCEERCVDDECSCAKISLKCWYDHEGRLKPDFNYIDAPLIFECNETCACNAITCINRVVQKGYTQRFQVFKTEFKGWGVKTLRPIPKGSYVCEYVGEILTDSDGELREDDSYLFDLDNRDTDSFCIDAKYYGNFARFINHSCDPNLHPVKVFVEHQDLRFPRIALFSRREIAMDEELSFDYGDKFWLIKYKSFTCDCGSESCKYSEISIDETLGKYRDLMEIS